LSFFFFLKKKDTFPSQENVDFSPLYKGIHIHLGMWITCS
jgi:hypothetical protein